MVLTAWGSAAPNKFQKVNTVKNQTLRIITGDMGLAPIIQLESQAELESLQERRDTKLMTQRLKWKIYETISTHCCALHKPQSRPEAIKEALKLMEEVTADQSGAKVVILSDSKSVPQKSEDPKASKQEYLRETLQNLEMQKETLILQWIPGH
ncbi:hypothetical protein ElyMa_006649300 [Elysia marginata]|uniref:RNase H type-1 domain-containing protein n=1 Tax=Elysia marginata TaxID=1093978 RepID=A0AAV4IJ85_9GAST|nr:hypothetical protein ElyMa_006649300 [Elysia marginata]